MKGNNTLVVCEAQMIEMAQSWLKRAMMPSETPAVTGVSWNSGDRCFIIKLTEPEAKGEVSAA